MVSNFFLADNLIRIDNRNGARNPPRLQTDAQLLYYLGVFDLEKNRVSILFLDPSFDLQTDAPDPFSWTRQEIERFQIFF